MNRSIALVGIITLFAACSIEQYALEPTFEVQGYEIEQIVDNLGNDVYQVSFRLSGDPDIVSFYSGEIESDYHYRDGRLLDYDALNLSFNTNVQFGTQENQFSVHVSTDFDGNYTFESVTGAEWTDITEGFDLGTGATFAPSGPKDISAYQEDGKPLYIAFRYVYRPRSEYGQANIWRVNNFNLSGVTAIGDVTIADQQSGAWSFVENFIDVPNTGTSADRARVEGNGNIMLANGNNGASVEVPTEAWCISRRLELDVIDNGPDRPVSIKRIIDPPLATYRYNYAEPGIYEAVFVVKNVTADDERQLVKTVQVMIPPFPL